MLTTMGMRMLSRAALAAVIVTGFAGPAFSSSFSFIGTFFHDNDVALFTFSLTSDAMVTLQTFGYGGGTNAAGTIIPAGGFESVLQVYDAASGVAVGGPIQPGVAPDCAPRNPDHARLSFCMDAFSLMPLTAGSYIVSLTQSPNDPLGNLSDGFYYVNAVPDPDFNNGFVGTLGLQGTSAWALDITGVDTAAPESGVPEPGSALLVATGLALAAIRARRRSW
jgi:hypothetical protein